MIIRVHALAGFSQAPLEERVALLKSSLVIGMVMLLKAHLKEMYSLSEEYVLLFEEVQGLTLMIFCG